ncbi:MAG: hypothetical protein HY902_20395, partial [Deltaproteobacteria bacterium]|nr:hypothetical protein [Deltaproteobacteria bacterium]
MTALAALVGCSAESPEPRNLAITKLEVSANPNSVLACRVTWHTAQPASSVVQFGLGSLAAPTWQRRDTRLRTEHAVDVYGMRAEQTYRLVVKVQSATQTAVATTQFTTGPLPPAVLPADVDVADAPPDGWVLASTHLGWAELGGLPSQPPAAVMYD